jgi:hypothetical protein
LAHRARASAKLRPLPWRTRGRGSRSACGTGHSSRRRLTKSVVRHEKRWGGIIGIQSTSVKQPVENIDLSNGIRPGIAGLMKAIMPYLAKDGITINLVLPANL